MSQSSDAPSTANSSTSKRSVAGSGGCASDTKKQGLLRADSASAKRRSHSASPLGRSASKGSGSLLNVDTAAARRSGSTGHPERATLVRGESGTGSRASSVCFDGDGLWLFSVGAHVDM